MLLRHATPNKNLASIRTTGLLTARATGRLQACWMHAQNKSAWAVVHTVKRHLVGVQDVVVLEVNVPRSWCRKSGKTGLWYCTRNIPASRLGRTIGFDELSSSPISDNDPPSTAEIASQLLVAK